MKGNGVTQLILEESKNDKFILVVDTNILLSYCHDYLRTVHPDSNQDMPEEYKNMIDDLCVRGKIRVPQVVITEFHTILRKVFAERDITKYKKILSDIKELYPNRLPNIVNKISIDDNPNNDAVDSIVSYIKKSDIISYKKHIISKVESTGNKSYEIFDPKNPNSNNDRIILGTCINLCKSHYCVLYSNDSDFMRFNKSIHIIIPKLRILSHLNNFIYTRVINNKTKISTGPIFNDQIPNINKQTPIEHIPRQTTINNNINKHGTEEISQKAYDNYVYNKKSSGKIMAVVLPIAFCVFLFGVLPLFGISIISDDIIKQNHTGSYYDTVKDNTLIYNTIHKDLTEPDNNINSINETSPNTDNISKLDEPIIKDKPPNLLENNITPINNEPKIITIMPGSYHAGSKEDCTYKYDGCFNPRSVTISPNQIITFINDDTMAHEIQKSKCNSATNEPVTKDQDDYHKFEISKGGSSDIRLEKSGSHCYRSNDNYHLKVQINVR